MKQGSTLILKLSIVALGVLVLALCAFALPPAIIAELKGDFDYGVIMIGMYATVVPFFIALFHTFKLLTYVDKNKAFTNMSVKALKNIKICAGLVSLMYAAGLPYIFYLADQDDAPGVFALGLIIVFVSFVIATAAAVLQKIFQHAVDIKSENDLTV